MHVVMVNYHYDADLAGPEDLLERYRTLTGLTAGLVGAGARVTMAQRFRADATRERDGGVFQMIADSLSPGLSDAEDPERFHRAIVEARPAVVHVHGTGFPAQVGRLRRLLPADVPLVVQHHAEGPLTGARSALQREGLAGVDGFFFTGRDLARPFQELGVIDGPIHSIMEGSCWFGPGDRAAAAAATGMRGDPALLWVGQLVAGKDPLTVLDGFERALPRIPGARLSMLYGTDALLSDVRARIARSPLLSGAVDLVGTVPHDRIEPYYQSADYFLLGSHSEGSGYALAEAMACGVIPVVTDIPSFRFMSGEGTIGALWPPGDAEGLCRALIEATSRPRAAESAATRRFFERRLSFPAIGREAMAFYREARARRRPTGSV